MELVYWPNPAHKRETTEVGPPLWRPDKTPCPRMKVDERQRLLRESLPEDPARSESKRYAFRVGTGGFEWFVAAFTRRIGADLEFHGYPTDYVPAKVLRQFVANGRISEMDYNRLRKLLG